jgi:hypothetical protein
MVFATTAPVAVPSTGVTTCSSSKKSAPGHSTSLSMASQSVDQSMTSASEERSAIAER